MTSHAPAAQGRCHGHDQHGQHPGGNGSDQAAAVAERVLDPVCGMKVDPATSKHRFEQAGRMFHFCSAGCRTKFAADPDRYLAPKEAPPPARQGVTYTCPMHPEVRQDGPGSCPICGMALEPLEAAAAAGPNPELSDMSRRFWIGLALTIPVVVLEMARHIPVPGVA